MIKTSLIGRTGKPVVNQEILIDKNFTYFKSYESIIAKVKNSGEVFLDKIFWNYSSTTNKYRAQFLSETTKETEKKIASGEYKLIDLNK